MKTYLRTRSFSGSARLRTGWISYLLLPLILLSALLIQGCESPQPPLKVGTNIWPGYESLYLARHKGFLDESQVSLVEKVNATQVLRAFKSRQLDVAALTMDEALTLMASQKNLRVIAVMDFSQGADVLLAKPEIQSLEDLAGRTLVVEKTAVGAIMLQGALERAGLEGYEVAVHNAGVNQHIAMWEQEDVAAVVTFEPFKSLLEAKGAHVLFDSSETPRRIMDVLVTTAETAEARPDQLSHLLKGHFSALDYMSRNRAESARVMSARLKIAPDQVWQSFEGLHIPGLQENRMLLGNSEEFMAQIRTLEQLMLKAGLIAEDVDISAQFLTDQFLPGAGE
ncbi:ABC transporter substrate-binding protein [Oceanospirillum sanctuarii]|uniref:ABC transporter substrate-binding protein n=1 Tax=Oceanospirillum sanctuarii TaxID=1434821 RepID=UPI000A36ABE8|nr:ABC transporter substrate-binding protein [Oceanospirillum sanctuarii]